MPGKSSSASRTPTGTRLRSALRASWQEEAGGTGCGHGARTAGLLEEAPSLSCAPGPLPLRTQSCPGRALSSRAWGSASPPHWKGSGLSQRLGEQRGTGRRPPSPFSHGGDPWGGSSSPGAPAGRGLLCLLPAPAWAPGKGLPELVGRPELRPPAGGGGGSWEQKEPLSSVLRLDSG